MSTKNEKKLCNTFFETFFLYKFCEKIYNLKELKEKQSVKIKLRKNYKMKIFLAFIAIIGINAVYGDFKRPAESEMKIHWQSFKFRHGKLKVMSKTEFTPKN